MNISPFRAIYPNKTLVTSPDSFFGTMKNQYPEFVKTGFFCKSEEEAVFVYEIKSGERTYRSVIASNDLKDFDHNKIRKHEDTIAVKEQNMMQLILQRNAMIKPVLLAYQGKKKINQFLNELVTGRRPFFEFEFEETGEVHTVYRIAADKKVAKLQKLFKEEVDKCYIADGHHRCSTTRLLSKGKYINNELKSILAVYFPFDELEIYDYNRSIEIRDEVSETVLMARLSRLFRITLLESGSKPKHKHQLTMHLDKRWYKLKWRKRVLAKYEKRGVILDADIFNTHVLEEVMEIQDIRNNLRVKYVEGTLGIDGITELSAASDQRRVGFCLYPVSMTELQHIADNGLNLPPKSTWFEPRVKNGMIVQEL